MYMHIHSLLPSLVEMLVIRKEKYKKEKIKERKAIQKSSSYSFKYKKSRQVNDFKIKTNL